MPYPEDRSEPSRNEFFKTLRRKLICFFRKADRVEAVPLAAVAAGTVDQKGPGLRRAERDRC